jgi:hypothetical protein
MWCAVSFLEIRKTTDRIYWRATTWAAKRRLGNPANCTEEMSLLPHYKLKNGKRGREVLPENRVKRTLERTPVDTLPRLAEIIENFGAEDIIGKYED